MKRVVKSLSVSIAAAALVSLAAAGCGTASTTSTSVGGGPLKSAPAAMSSPTAQAGFAGYKWSVVAIGHDGKQTPIPARYSVYLQFTPNGQFGANEPINYHFGTYRQVGDGFTTSNPGSTLAGYAGGDPVSLLAINAISSFDRPIRATAIVTGDRLAVTVNGYTLTCQRDGAQANFPPATPSGVAATNVTHG
jgi:heat shock protein HslJ